MKRQIKGGVNRFASVLLGCSLAVFAACSDGSITQEETPVVPGLNPAAIEAFEITQTDDPTNTSTEGILVKPGTSVTLTWRVSGAESVELASESGSVAQEVVKVTGSKEVKNLQANETFVLTALNQGVATQKKVTATVSAAKPVAQVVSFTATPAQLNLGGTTKLCFEASPADATVTVTDAAGATLELEQAAATDDGTTADDDVVTADDETDTTDDDGTVNEATEDDAAENTGALLAMAKLSIAAATIVSDDADAPADVAVPDVGDAADDETATDEDDADEEEEGEEQAGESDDEAAAADATDTLKGCTLPQQVAAGSHVFRLSVVDSDGNTAESEVTVAVAAPVIVKDFGVNGGATATVKSGDALTFTWTVEPANAKVSIAPGVGDVTTTDATTGQGSVTTKADVSTTFTLTATHPETDESTTKTVTVTVEAPAAGVATLTLSASAVSVFAGETVTFTVAEATAEGLSLTLPSGATIAMTGGSATVAVSEAGGYQATAKGSDGSSSALSNAVSISVQKWGVAKSSGKAWSTVAAHPTQDVFVAGAKDAMVGAHTGSNDWNVNAMQGPPNSKGEKASFAELLSAASNMPDDRIGKFAPFHVHSFAFDSQKDGGKRVYAGTVGGLLASQDGGESWKALDHMIVWDKAGKYRDNAYTFTSCDGVEQTGISSKDTDLVGFHSVCDIEIDPATGRLIVATDTGVAYLENPDTVIADGLSKATGWKGYEKSPLKDVLTHDLALSASGLYAATQKGVYLNTQAGDATAWTAVSGGELGEGPVYSVAVDENNGLVFAGTASGEIAVLNDGFGGGFVVPMPIDSTDGTGAPTTSESPSILPVPSGSWTVVKTADGAVHSLTVDAESGAVLAGTVGGVYLSRDGGKSWTDLSASMNSDVETVFAVAAAHGVFAAATDKGVYVSRAEGAGASVIVDDAEDDDTATATDEQPADDTVAPATTATGANGAIL
jgi:hypothetical protein